jgi:hypothetical protein
VRVYRIEPFAYVFAAATALFTVFAAVSFVTDPQPFFLFFTAVLGWFWFNVLRSPYEVRLSPDGTVEFRALARRIDVPAAAIRSITGQGFQYGYVVTWDTSKAWLRVPVRETFDLISRIRTLNPAVALSRV